MPYVKKREPNPDDGQVVEEPRVEQAPMPTPPQQQPQDPYAQGPPKGTTPQDMLTMQMWQDMQDQRRERLRASRPAQTVQATQVGGQSTTFRAVTELERELKKREAIDNLLSRLAPKPNPIVSILDSEFGAGLGTNIGKGLLVAMEGWKDDRNLKQWVAAQDAVYARSHRANAEYDAVVSKWLQGVQLAAGLKAQGIDVPPPPSPPAPVQPPPMPGGVGTMAARAQQLANVYGTGPGPFTPPGPPIQPPLTPQPTIPSGWTPNMAMEPQPQMYPTMDPNAPIIRSAPRVRMMDNAGNPVMSPFGAPQPSPSDLQAQLDALKAKLQEKEDELAIYKGTKKPEASPVPANLEELDEIIEEGEPLPTAMANPAPNPANEESKDESEETS